MPHGRHRLFARFYARISPLMERGLARYRDELLAGLSGQVMEVGAGAGANFAHYPSEVTDVLAVEPEPHLRDLAQQAAAQAPVPVEVVDELADRLPAADQAFDAVVFRSTGRRDEPPRWRDPSVVNSGLTPLGRQPMVDV